MDRRRRILIGLGAAAAAAAALLLWTAILGGGATVTIIGLAGILGLAFVYASLARPRRGWLASLVLGLLGAAIAWSLAFLAFGIRSLCLGNPDAVARDACDAQWLATATVLAATGLLSLAMGLRAVRQRRGGAG